MTDYLTMLAGRPPQGDAARRAFFTARVAKMTGHPRGRRRKGLAASSAISDRKDLRSADGKVVSIYDASIAGRRIHFPEQARLPADPIRCLTALTRAYGGAFGRLCARSARLQKPRSPYTLLANRQIGGKWEWREREAGNRLRGAGDDLRDSPHLQSILPAGHRPMAIANLVTPYMASRYVINHPSGNR